MLCRIISILLQPQQPAGPGAADRQTRPQAESGAQTVERVRRTEDYALAGHPDLPDLGGESPGKWRWPPTRFAR